MRIRAQGDPMLDQATQTGSDDLQFDRVSTGTAPSAPPGKVAVTCAACQTSIESTYFEVNGSILCRLCRARAESAAEKPRGIVPFMIATIYGLGAGVVGAIIYYAVIAITNFEIGIVAILIGYMVGYAVHKGAGLRGSRRFQVLAVALTYLSIALAYAPLVFNQATDTAQSAQDAGAATASGNSDATAATETVPAATAAIGTVEAPTEKVSGRRALLSLVLLAAFIAALPVIAVFGSLPSGLISAFIIFIGMKQAWKMTGAPSLQILGPYRVGAAPAATPA
jgi:hypothetical protein